MSAAAQQESGSPAAERAPLLRLDAIVKRFPGVLALDRVDFDLRPGEVHVLFGENGAGKSTLISIAAGALRPGRRRHRLLAASRSSCIRCTTPARSASARCSRSSPWCRR